MKEEIKVKIDTPRFSFKKYKDDGSVDYISPIPFTTNYGSILDTISEEGDKVDAFVLGKTMKKGEVQSVLVVGKIDFYDRGKYDPKYICSMKPVSALDKLNVWIFFNLFAISKMILNKLRGKKGKTGIRKISFNPIDI